MAHRLFASGEDNVIMNQLQAAGYKPQAYFAVIICFNKSLTNTSC
jgi:hypothetical protein